MHRAVTERYDSLPQLKRGRPPFFAPLTGRSALFSGFYAYGLTVCIMPDQDRSQESNTESLLQEVDRQLRELQQRIELAREFDEFFRALGEATKTNKKPPEERELFRQIAQEAYGGKEIVAPEAISGALRRAMMKLKGSPIPTS